MGEPDPRQGAAMKQRSAVGLPSTKWSVSSQHATSVVEALTERADELVDHLEKVTMDARKQSDSAWVPLPISAHKTAVATVRSVVAATAAPAMFDPEPAIQLGADQARQQLAGAAVIEADRIGFRGLWQVVAAEATRHPDVDAQTLQQMTANLHATQDLFATAKFTRYR